MADIYTGPKWQYRSQPLEISSEKFAGKRAAAMKNLKIALLVFCASASAVAAQVVAADAVVDASALQPVAEERSGSVDIYLVAQQILNW